MRNYISRAIFFIFIFLCVGQLIVVGYEFHRNYDELVKFADLIPFWKTHLEYNATRFALFFFIAYYVRNEWMDHDRD